MKTRQLGRSGLTVSTSVVLSADDLNDIEAAVSSVQVQGARYSADRQKLVGS